MENNIQIGLFFNRDHYFDTILLASKFKEKVEDLGDGAVIPYNGDISSPLIIFDNSIQIKLMVFANHVLITLPVNQEIFFKKNLKSIIDVLEKEKIELTRIGYLKTIILGEQESILFKNNAFDDNEILHADEYQVSYYKLIKINNLNVNCWKKYMTDKSKFIISFDLNTLMEEEQNIDYNYVINYIKNCDNYIEENQIANLF